MRSDFLHILTERGSVGGQGKATNRRLRSRTRNTESREDAAFEVRKHKVARRYDRKEARVHTTPLYRFLRTNVGRRWDDVYAEMCERFDIRSDLSRFLRSFVFGYGGVATNTADTPDGVEVRDYAPRSVGYACQNEFYVHPVTGLLCEAEKLFVKRATRSRSWRLRSVRDGVFLAKIAGVWYEITTRPRTEDDVRAIRSTAAHKIVEDIAETAGMPRWGLPEWFRSTTDDLFGEPLWPVAKRQLDSRALRRLGLRAA